MKTLQHFLATMLLVLALGIPAYAGDVSGTTDAPTHSSTTGDSAATVKINSNTSSTANLDMPTLAMHAINLLLSALTIY